MGDCNHFMNIGKYEGYPNSGLVYFNDFGQAFIVMGLPDERPVSEESEDFKNSADLVNYEDYDGSQKNVDNTPYNISIVQLSNPIGLTRFHRVTICS